MGNVYNNKNCLFNHIYQKIFHTLYYIRQPFIENTQRKNNNDDGVNDINMLFWLVVNLRRISWIGKKWRVAIQILISLKNWCETNQIQS